MSSEWPILKALSSPRDNSLGNEGRLLLLSRASQQPPSEVLNLLTPKKDIPLRLQLLYILPITSVSKVLGLAAGKV